MMMLNTIVMILTILDYRAWAKNTRLHKSKSALFGIVQGGMYKDLKVSLNKLIDH